MFQTKRYKELELPYEVMSSDVKLVFLITAQRPESRFVSRRRSFRAGAVWELAFKSALTLMKGLDELNVVAELVLFSKVGLLSGKNPFLHHLGPISQS